MPKKKPLKGKPETHKDLEGLEIKINEFGQIITNYEVDNINSFLDEKGVGMKEKDQSKEEE